MRGVSPLILCLCLLTSLAAGSQKAELRKQKKAQKDAAQAIEFIRAGDLAKAQELLDEAWKLDPRNVSALTGRELLRQNQIQQKVTEANWQLESNQRDKAVAGFRQALKLDPDNPFAQQGLHSALQDLGNGEHPRIQYRDADEVHIEPASDKHDFHFKGDTRGLLGQVWNAYGVRPLIDNSVTSKQARLDLEGADFATASIITSEMTKTFYVPLSKNQALIVADTLENRKNFERLALRTFYIGDASSAQDINDAVTLLRSVFDFKFTAPAAGSNQVTVRAPLSILEPATRILEDLYSGKPQVMLDINIFQVEQTLARDLGLGFPTQYTLFNVKSEEQNLLNSGSNQNLINQLISSGAINQANSSSIAALLAALAAGGSSNSIVNQPLATFGGGLTQSGVIIPGTTIHASLNESSFQSLDHIMLRAAQGDAATFRDGMRYPILNASFAPLSNSPAISSVLANQSFTAPFPSFSYEDLGITLKATPTVHGNRDVSLKLEFQLRGLGATQLNGVPVLTNREYTGAIGVPLGETAVLAGMVSKSEQLSLQGLPGLSQLPILGAGTSVKNKQTDDAELLVTIRPYLVRDSVHNPNAGTAFVPPVGEQ